MTMTKEKNNHKVFFLLYNLPNNWYGPIFDEVIHYFLTSVKLEKSTVIFNIFLYNKVIILSNKLFLRKKNFQIKSAIILDSYFSNFNLQKKCFKVCCLIIFLIDISL